MADRTQRPNRSLLEVLTHTNYYTACAHRTTRLRLQRRRRAGASRREVVIYQMGKVASTSIYESLKLHPQLKVYHVHTLDPARMAWVDRQERDRFAKTRSINRHYIESRFLRPRLGRPTPNGKWKIITLVREPIIRNISAFFQVRGLEALSFDHDGHPGMQTIDELAREHIEFFLNEHDDHDRPLEWFDKELKRATGVDVFARPFPTGQGYDIYHGDAADVLLLRMEDLDTCAREAIGAFLDLDDFRLITRNVAREKAYYPLYRRFRELIRLPDAYLDRMYDSRFARLFYSPQERARFRARWEKNTLCAGEA